MDGKSVEIQSFWADYSICKTYLPLVYLRATL